MPSSTPKLLSSLSFACGVVGILLMLVFLLTALGNGVFYASLSAGIVGIILAVVALTRRQAKGLAVTGVTLSSVTVLTAIGIILFALIFVGAISV